MTLFLSRHFIQPKSPDLFLRLHSAAVLAVQFQMVLACSCASLKSLDISNLLSIVSTQALLGMLPVSLANLDIFSSASVIEGPGWGRLTALTTLTLWIDPDPAVHSVRRSQGWRSFPACKTYRSGCRKMSNMQAKGQLCFTA